MKKSGKVQNDENLRIVHWPMAVPCLKLVSSLLVLLIAYQYQILVFYLCFVGYIVICCCICH